MNSCVCKYISQLCSSVLSEVGGLYQAWQLRSHRCPVDFNRS